MSATRGYAEHVAICVKDIDWHIQYFREVFGMEVVKKAEQDGKLKQVWLHGGVQLTATPDFEISELEKQGVHHIGIMAEDLESAVNESYARGLQQMKGKEKNWVLLPDGVVLEIMQAKETVVAEALAIHPR